jgi:hypothetical protein
MNRRLILSLFAAGVWPRLAAAEAEPKAAGAVRPEDAGVLEAVLLDVLSDPKSPVEPRAEKRDALRFSAARLDRGAQLSTVLRQQDPKEWAKLSAAQMAQVQAAASELERRVEAKDDLSGFQPKDARLIRHSPEAEKLQPEGAQRFRRPQVFWIYPPGYSTDRQLVVVHLAFPWSGGFHSGDSTYILTRKDDRWIILLKQFVYYV